MATTFLTVCSSRRLNNYRYNAYLEDPRAYAFMSVQSSKDGKRSFRGADARQTHAGS